jgi:hypothetical protein
MHKGGVPSFTEMKFNGYEISRGHHVLGSCPVHEVYYLGKEIPFG